MKNFNRRAISVALLITLGAMFSVNASAAETNGIENSISEMVIAQGQQVMSDLTAQLQQSITEEINSFNVDFSFDESITKSIDWLTEETEFSTAEDTKQVKQSEVNQVSQVNHTTETKLLN